MTTFNEAIWLEKARIIATSRHAIIRGMHDTWSRCSRIGNLPQEPDFVAGLVLESCPQLHISLASILAKYQIGSSLLAVYCHQTPQVTHPKMTGESCELGDVLFAHVHTDDSGLVRRNAILYQAKTSSSEACRIPKDDQLKLYSEWPDFEYWRSMPLAGHRSLVPKMIQPGAQYLLIDSRPATDPRSGLLGLPGKYPTGSCMPSDLLRSHNDLAAELFELLLVRSGMPFTDRTTASLREDWSRVVWDLLDVGVRKAFNRKRSGRRNASRISDDVKAFDGISFVHSTSPVTHSTVTNIVGRRDAGMLMSSDIGNGALDGPLDHEESDPESGTSIVLLETRSLREE